MVTKEGTDRLSAFRDPNCVVDVEVRGTKGVWAYWKTCSRKEWDNDSIGFYASGCSEGRIVPYNPNR